MRTRHQQVPEWLPAAVLAPVHDVKTLERAAKESGLNEELALALLRRRDLPGTVIEKLARNERVARLRAVRHAVVCHQHTPRHISLPLLRHFYPFELMKLALIPQLPADLKRAAEEALVAKSAALSAGERLTLAKRGSSRLAAELVLDADPRVSEAALKNPRLTEEGVVRALLDPRAPSHFSVAVCHDRKWRLRSEVRVAALRCEFTPLAHAIDFAGNLREEQLSQVLAQSKLPLRIREYLLQTAAHRTAWRRSAGR